jgi:hypothetical protein
MPAAWLRSTKHLIARGLERFPPKWHLAPPFGADFRIPNGIFSEFALTFGRLAARRWNLKNRTLVNARCADPRFRGL